MRHETLRRFWIVASFAVLLATAQPALSVGLIPIIIA